MWQCTDPTIGPAAGLGAYRNFTGGYQKEVVMTNPTPTPADQPDVPAPPLPADVPPIKPETPPPPGEKPPESPPAPPAAS